MSQFGNITRGSLLIAGTSIGGGMLALPVMTSQSGFFPSLIVYLVCWLFMACTGLLFLEVSFWMKKEANIVSMAGSTLGAPGKIVAWGLYLFLFYCLTLAYIVGSGGLIVEIFGDKWPLKDWQGQIIFLLLFAPFVYAGTQVVGRLNIFLMLGLGLSFLCFIFLGYSHVNTDYLRQADWSKIGIALPITFTAFAYQGIIPSLVHYMHRDVRQLRLVILIGSFLPFITYAIWQWLILGIVPAHGPGGLIETMHEGHNAIYPLKNILDIASVYLVGQFFAFFALITSFFGVTLGLLDFLADGMQIEKNGKGRILLCALIFIPPLLIAFAYPHVFLLALDYAGGFGCALLLGLFPIFMVWRGRYVLGLTGPYRVQGGRGLLAILAAFVLLELVCEFIF